MELMRDFEAGIVERIERDPAFARAMLDEVNALLAAGDDEPVPGMLRVLIKGTVGFDYLSRPLSMTGETLRQMLSASSHPAITSLSAIANALKLEFGMTPS